MKTLYDILEVSKTASIEEIKRAYRRLALKYHPDVNKGKDTVQKFKEVVHAYEILSDAKKRAEYDRTMGNGSSYKQSGEHEKKQQQKQKSKTESKEQYFYMQNGIKHGPFSLEHVQNLFLEENTLILKLGEKAWQKIQDREEFEEFWIPTIPTFWNVAYESAVEKTEKLKIQLVETIEKLKEMLKILFKRLVFAIVLFAIVIPLVAIIISIFKSFTNDSTSVPVATPVETVAPVATNSLTPTSSPTPLCTFQECFFKEKCLAKPEHAFCITESTTDAWQCEKGYFDTGKECVKEFTGGMFRGKNYGTITSSTTGRVWLDRNLGADRVCQSTTDEQCYGEYYEWNENFKKTDGTGVCPNGFHIPTEAELSAENIKNAQDAFKKLKIPLAGYRDYSYSGGLLIDVGSLALLWSSTPSDLYPYVLLVPLEYNPLSDNLYYDYNIKNALSLRCVQ